MKIMKKRYEEVKERVVMASETSVVKEQLVFLETYRSRTGLTTMGNVTAYIGDVTKSLHLLPEGIVDCVITSPPYWKQRDYKDPHQIGQENSCQEYIRNLVNVFSEIRRVLKPTGTLFLNVGYKYQNKELLLIPELLAAELQRNGWSLLNKIVWYKPNAMPSSLDSRFSNVYEPIFLFVKKESKYKYYLSIDALRLPVSNFANNKNPEDILGFEVENSLLKDKKIKGYISKVFKNSKDDIFAQVDWNDGENTLEIVQGFDKESQISIDLICQDCGKPIKHEIDIDSHLNCKGFAKPILPPTPDFKDRIELKPSSLFPSVSSQSFQGDKRLYKGKFKLSPDNRGASPGARKSLFGEYLN